MSTKNYQLTTEEEKLFYSNDRHKIVEYLKNMMDDPKKAYSLAERYCNDSCEENWKLSPMITCAYKCKIWMLKNELIKKINQNDKF